MQAIEQLKHRSPRWLRNRAVEVTERYGRATERWRSAPDFLIVGSKRGGTTSLHNYLLMHPGVLGLFPRPRGQKSSDYLFSIDARGLGRYRSYFHTGVYKSRVAERLHYQPLSGESSPLYIWDPRIARLAHEANPKLRAIMLVRDPVQRAFSHWQERVQNDVEPLSFSDALEAEPARTAGELDRMFVDASYYSEAYDWYSYRARGIYLPQLQNWTSVFPRAQLLVLRSEDMYEDVQATFETVCRFLDLPPMQLPTTKAFNASRKPDMPAGPSQELSNYYSDHNAELEAYLGRSLSWS